MGAKGVEVLIKNLGKEANEKVLEASLRALGHSAVPAAITYLLDLLFEAGALRYWPYRREEGGWGDLIHMILSDAGAA
jgi:hypothetical protein